ncbi:family 20 glycosylhydrolase [Flavihumibacter petaseus]|uniref:beta-N-acetylhexosaminidase n=1 Tax=Flavihumibacter petaseus NBRC 106054 TaxID=1220578 RepID=A0A0E9MV20_9BACT|nr:family 20 glycosylhydrolase [Flavihumibacter petaseus]GAO41348.1 putative glycosidase [Flavihumibacter petaseus NBRC 106054]
MRKYLFTLIITLVTATLCRAQVGADSLYPIRAFAIEAPRPANLEAFLQFMKQELAPRKINRLILRVEYNFSFRSHPELIDTGALTLADVTRIAQTAAASGMEIIPQINLLGHQSWASRTGKLLAVYPQFDETPWVKIPEKYAWPNADSLYCKSYCPLHPDVHKIVYDLVDELCDAFHAKSFHAGLDEVFYIGDSRCPRCKGKDKAVLFAGEAKKIRDHLALKNRTLWIWGDRLIDGTTTGIGGWEASFNYTWPAIDLIPKDIVICDWHYERADKTAVYFAAKGFPVITCTWNRPAVAVEQARDMQRFRTQSTPEMSGRFLGMMQTVWSPAGRFLTEVNQRPAVDTVGANGRSSQWYTFRQLFP